MQYIIPIGIIVIVVIFYVLTYAINEKTAIPDECQDLVDDINCTACSVGHCSMRKTDVK